MQLDATALDVMERTGLAGRAAELEKIAVPAVGIRIRALTGLEPATLGSRYGGVPLLPPDVNWPKWESEPLPFLCQINLAEISQYPGAVPLPREGLLSFFYRHETLGRITFGAKEDVGAWRVLYVPHAEFGVFNPAAPGQALPVQYPERALAFHAELSFPDTCPFDASHEEVLAYSTFVNEVSKRYAGDRIGWGYQAYGSHRLLGHWLGVQFGDPLQEAHATSAALDWWETDSLALPASDEWGLLLQIDSDYAAGLDLAGSGMAYFCIPRQDLAAHRFDRVWLVFKAT